MRRPKAKPVKLLNPSAAVLCPTNTGVSAPFVANEEQAYCDNYLKLADKVLQAPIGENLKKAS